MQPRKPWSVKSWASDQQKRQVAAALSWTASGSSREKRLEPRVPAGDSVASKTLATTTWGAALASSIGEVRAFPAAGVTSHPVSGRGGQQEIWHAVVAPRKTLTLGLHNNKTKNGSSPHRQRVLPRV
eukprot:scaffold13881_cov124-Isochrysis_galbana.AAC.9